MKFFIAILLIVGLGFCQMPRHFEAHYVGVVTEVKIVGASDVISLWVLTDRYGDYVAKSFGEIPRIYVGDSLYEYWTNYQKTGIGTSRGLVIYSIEEKR